MAGNPNYGVLLYYVASGDVTEFYSYRHGTAGNRPSIILDYSTDSPPVATMDGPPERSGRPGRPLPGRARTPTATRLPASTSRSSKARPSSIRPSSLARRPSRTSRRATSPAARYGAQVAAAAGGLVSPAVRVDFTVDRPPVVVSFAGPPASSSNRRPLVDAVYSDPDGNVADLFDLEIYATSGGAPAGAPVYVVVNQGAGINSTNVWHTVATDLPGGNLVVRVRVRSGPAYLWSGWSGYHPFLIALTSPTLAWLSPESVGAYSTLEWMDHLESAFDAAYGIHRVEIWPPAGQTLTRLRLWISGVNSDPSVGGTLVFDIAPDPVGGLFSYGLSVSAAGATVYSSAWEATASGGGVTKSWRMGRLAGTEWIGRVFLGDNVTALDPDHIDGGGDDAWRWYRAEDAAGTVLSAWGTPAAALAAMPATGAYLGLRVRSAKKTQDGNTLTNGSFEDGLAGWATDAGTTYLSIAGGPDGSKYLRIPGDGVTSYPQVRQTVSVVPGGTYRLAGWIGTFEAPATIIVRADAIYAAGGSTGGVISFSRASSFDTGLTYYTSAPFTVPPGVSALQVLAFIAAAPAASNVDGRFDGLALIGPIFDTGGLDSWRIDWTSAG